MALENSIRDPRTQIGGLVALVDFSGLRLGHAKYLSPHLAKRTVEVIQDVFPMRFKAFHILHEPFYFDAILAILKHFLKEKIRNRVRQSPIPSFECFFFFWLKIIFIFFFSFHRFIYMVVISNRYIATFQKKFYRPSMAESRAILIIQSGEKKLFVIIIISYAWSRMARSQLLKPMAAQK